MTSSEPASTGEGPESGAANVLNNKQFHSVLLEFGPALARLIRGYERNEDASRDLLQEIHLAVWRSLETFDSRCSLRTWVYRVAHNTAIKYVLREKRRGFVKLQSLEEVEEPSDPGSLEDDAHRATALERLLAVISQLKPMDRQVILLYVEDLSASEIAEITGLSPGAVGVRIHRTKQLLHKIFR